MKRIANRIVEDSTKEFAKDLKKALRIVEKTNPRLAERVEVGWNEVKDDFLEECMYNEKLCTNIIATAKSAGLF